MRYSRREFGALALGAIPVLAVRPGAQARRPNSKVNGVQIAMNAPYNFGNNNMSADEVLTRCLDLGVSAVELRSQPVESFLGIPADLVAAAAPAGRAVRSPEQVAAAKDAAEALRKWRVAVPMSRVADFRRKYEDAGVLIEIVKFDNIYARSDDEIDYCFALTKALGARAVSCEIDVPETRRLGQFAGRHRMMVGYHGHTATGPHEWEEAFAYARFNGANLDLGHFVGGQKTSPIPFLTKYHDRITHVHVKDKTLKDVNVPFGEGDTPIVEALQLIRDRKWNIQATIEFEYPVPAGSDRMVEIKRCVDYCRRSLA